MENDLISLEYSLFNNKVRECLETNSSGKSFDSNIISNNTFFKIKNLLTCLGNNIHEGFTNDKEYNYTYYLLFVILVIILLKIYS